MDKFDLIFQSHTLPQCCIRRCWVSVVRYSSPLPPVLLFLTDRLATDRIEHVCSLRSQPLEIVRDVVGRDVGSCSPLLLFRFLFAIAGVHELNCEAVSIGKREDLIGRCYLSCVGPVHHMESAVCNSDTAQSALFHVVQPPSMQPLVRYALQKAVPLPRPLLAGLVHVLLHAPVSVRPPRGLVQGTVAVVGTRLAEVVVDDDVVVVVVDKMAAVVHTRAGLYYWSRSRRWVPFLR